MVADLVFMMATLDAKGLFGVSVLKNPARYTYLPYQITRTISTISTISIINLFRTCKRFYSKFLYH